MPDFDDEHLLLTVNGDLGNPVVEHWTFGIRGSWGGPYTADVLQAAVHSMAPSTSTLFEGSCTTIATCTHLKLAHILANGHYPPGESAFEHTFTPPLNGGAAQTGQPYQCALAVSLTTAFGRGNAHAGRFFLPMPKAAVVADGRISAVEALAQANRVKVWLNALGALGFDAAVFSRGGVVDPLPVRHEITGVRVGRVVDTMRSRRRNLVEDYQAVAL